jgi:hypothetical protein
MNKIAIRLSLANPTLNSAVDASTIIKYELRVTTEMVDNDTPSASSSVLPEPIKTVHYSSKRMLWSDFTASNIVDMQDVVDNFEIFLDASAVINSKNYKFVTVSKSNPIVYLAGQTYPWSFSHQSLKSSSTTADDTVDYILDIVLEEETSFVENNHSQLAVNYTDAIKNIEYLKSIHAIAQSELDSYKRTISLTEIADPVSGHTERNMLYLLNQSLNDTAISTPTNCASFITMYDFVETFASHADNMKELYKLVKNYETAKKLLIDKLGSSETLLLPPS